LESKAMVAAVVSWKRMVIIGISGIKNIFVNTIEYIFGGYNTNHINGTLTTIPVDKSQGFWGVTVSSIKEGTTSVSSSFSAILDTGTTLLLLPQTVSAKVAKAYGAKDNGDGTYTISKY
jgi:hypothetical protein